ncbi:MAG TPA: diguanylate cyclase [Egicoccus sp.]|nr:diguanylate cyclase [Egicoccus sp.]HSK24883.1 diguanylate cyclase [Egicoccus sp.]
MQQQQAEKQRAMLVVRFRRLFSWFTGAVAVGLVLQVVDTPVPQRPVALAAAVGVALWAAGMRYFGDRSVLVDLAGFVPLTGVGFLVVSQLNLIPLLFAIAFQRGFHAPARRAHALALASVVVWQVTRTAVAVAPRAGSAIALGVVLVGATSFAGTVRRESDRRDLATRREQRLLESVRAMAALSDPRHILHEVALTGVDLVERTGTAAVVWERDGDVFRAVATSGTIRSVVVESASLPGQVLHVFETGQPTVLDGAVARELQHTGQDTRFYPAYVMVPLPRADRPQAALLLYCTVAPDAELLEMLRRFAIEAGLAEERATLQSKLAEREARLSSIIEHSSDVIALLDPEGRFTMVNRSAELRFGHRVEDVLGRSVFHLVHPDDRDAVTEAMRGVFEDDAITTSERLSGVQIACRMRTASGEWRDVESRLTSREGSGYVLNSRDVTERKALEAEIVHRAFHDPLTDLANRALFFDRLEHAIERGRRTGAGVAVLMIDLDDFKPVNDTYGHAAGDAVLVEVAERLRSVVRDCDTPARLGGDEFAVLVEGTGNLPELGNFADRVHGALRVPIRLGGHDVRVSASIGAATSRPGEHHEQLMRRADDAMYAVKFRGKDEVEVVADDGTPPALVDLPAGDAQPSAID